MNVALLKQVAAQIVATPVQFDINEWDCGTTACIAGWAGRLSGFILDSEWPRLNRDHGARMLGLTTVEARRLFYAENWPLSFQKRMEKAEFDEDREAAALTAAERIDHFIATEGRE